MKLQALPIFKDNYIWMLIEETAREVLVVDPGEAETLITYLEDHNLRLKLILVTHDHLDHIGGIDKLKVHFPDVRICSHQTNSQRLNFHHHQIQMLKTPGHLEHHVSYLMPDLNILFCGDTLFSLGCGRIFESDYEKAALQLWTSLNLLKQITNQQTLVCCTHEYTLKNALFGQTLPSPYTLHQEIIEQIQNNLTLHQTTLPSTMGFELLYNPFLKTPHFEDFLKLRRLRDQF
jgi:hydroxyacylglutathione hydrolase